MGSVVVHASKSSVQVTQNGVTLAVLPFSLPLQTFAHQTTPYQATMAGGATLLAHILTLPCPCFSKLLSTELVLSQFHTAGKRSASSLFCSVFVYFYRHGKSFLVEKVISSNCYNHISMLLFYVDFNACAVGSSDSGADLYDFCLSSVTSYLGI